MMIMKRVATLMACMVCVALAFGSVPAMGALSGALSPRPQIDANYRSPGPPIYDEYDEFRSSVPYFFQIDTEDGNIEFREPLLYLDGSDGPEVLDFQIEEIWEDCPLLKAGIIICR